LEEAAREVTDEITAPRPPGHETVEEIHVMLISDSAAVPIRELRVMKKEVLL
jgi:DNA replication licensing factor MCM5